MKRPSNVFLIADDPKSKQDFFDYLTDKLTLDETKDFIEDYEIYLKLERTSLTCELEITESGNLTEYVYILNWKNIKLATSTVKAEKYGKHHIFIHEELKVEDDFKDPQFIHPGLIDHDSVPPKSQLSGGLFGVDNKLPVTDLTKELRLGLELRPNLKKIHISMGLLNKDGSLSKDLPEFVRNKLQPVVDSENLGNTPSLK